MHASSSQSTFSSSQSTFSSSQITFTSNASFQHVVWVILSEASECCALDYNERLYIEFLDASKAFDIDNHVVLRP